MRQTFCGTPLYFSPELLKGEKYNEKVDIWAIGVLIYELIAGRAPFNLKLPTDLPNIVHNCINLRLLERYHFPQWFHLR